MDNINRIFGVFYHLILSLMSSVGNSCFGAGLLWPGIAGGVGGGGSVGGGGLLWGGYPGFQYGGCCRRWTIMRWSIKVFLTKPYDKLLDNSCIPFLLLIVTFCFTCGDRKICENIKGLEVILTTVSQVSKMAVSGNGVFINKKHSVLVRFFLSEKEVMIYEY